MKNFHRNIFVLCAAFCFAAGIFSGISASAQKKTPAKTVKPAPTPKNQKSAAKTPAKTATAAPKKPAAKTSDKMKASSAAKPKSPDKSKSAAKSSIEKNKSATKQASSLKEKSIAAKSSAKSAAPAKTATKTNSTVKASTAAKTNASTKQTKTVEKSSSDSKIAAKTAALKTSASASSQIIVAATSARVRSEPNAGAGAVSTVDIGRILPVLEESSGWYRVKLADDKSGWISKQVAADFTDARRAEIYQKIVGKYFKGKMDFADAAQIFDFLTAAEGEVKAANAQADFAFKRLQALSAALKLIPSGKGEQNPYKDFLKTNEKQIVYSEPSGEWYVRSDYFWETHAKYKDAPAGEEIARLAAQTPLPGECEGYVNCYIYLARVTDGEYLNFYPGGKYARKSVQNITSLLDPIVADLKSKTVYTAATDISDRAEFNRLLTELRTIISKVPFAEKSKAIQQINQIGEGFR